MKRDSAFVSIETAIREIRAGHMIVVVDDENRKNEGDLTLAVEMVPPEAINFMATYGKDLICLAMTGENLERLNLSPWCRIAMLSVAERLLSVDWLEDRALS